MNVADFPLLSKDCITAMMAQMSRAAAASSSPNLAPNMITSSLAASEMVHQALLLSRAQQILEDQQQRGMDVRENLADNESSTFQKGKSDLLIL